MRVSGRIAASTAAGSVKSTKLTARAAAHPLHEPVGAAVDVVGRNDVVAALQQLQHGRDPGEAGGEGEAGGAAFEIGDAALEGHARRVVGSAVFVALVYARAFLRVGR